VQETQVSGSAIIFRQVIRTGDSKTFSVLVHEKMFAKLDILSTSNYIVSN